MHFMDSYEWAEIDKLLEELRLFTEAEAAVVCLTSGSVLFSQGASTRIADGVIEGVAKYSVAAGGTAVTLGNVDVMKSEGVGEYYAVPYPETYLLVLGVQRVETEEFLIELRRQVNLLALALHDLFRLIEQQRGGGGERGGTSFNGNSSATYTTDRKWTG